VVFGDGQYGMIPPVGAPLLATYRTGGGAFGNVGAGQITVITNASQLQLLGAKVINRSPASGGADREAIDQAARFAPSVFTSMNRAVTAADYVAQALLFPGVFKTRAVADNWNSVVLFIAPHGLGEEPSDILIHDLLAYFEDKRMLTSHVKIASPSYVPLEVTVEIGAKPYFRNVDVLAAASAALQNLFSFDNADFGQTLYLSKVYEAVETLDGVEFVVVDNFRRKPVPPATGPLIDPTGRIVLDDDEIPVLASADLSVSVTGGVSGASA
jgi:predicted phage baseplate assembly protein